MEKSITSVMLQERDLKILEFLAKFGVANEKHLMNLVGIKEEAMSNYTRIIRRLIVSGYVEKQRLIAGQYAYILLGPRGEALLSTKRMKNLILNTLRHDMLVLDVYFDIMSKNPDYTVMSERELRIATGLKVGDKKKVPDLLINEKIAVEVELTEKSNARLVEIISNYVNDTNLESVHYYVKSKALGYKILELAGNHPKFKIFLLNLNSKVLEYSLIIDENRVTTQQPSSANSFDLNAYLQQ